MKRKLFGMMGGLVILLALGLVLAGCKTEDDGGDSGPSLTLSGTPKVGEELTATGTDAYNVTWETSTSASFDSGKAGIYYSAADMGSGTLTIRATMSGEGGTINMVGKYIRAKGLTGNTAYYSNVLGPITQ